MAKKKKPKKMEPGERFEHEVAGNCRLIEARGRAFADKIPTPVKVTKHSGGQSVGGRLLRGEFVDFVGMLAGGRLVAFECKSCEGTSFPFSALRSKSGSEHQREFLARVAKFGGVAFVYVEHRKTEERMGAKMTVGVDRYVFPVDRWAVIARTTDRESFPFEGGRNYDAEKAALYRLRPDQFWIDRVEELLAAGGHFAN